MLESSMEYGTFQKTCFDLGRLLNSSFEWFLVVYITFYDKVNERLSEAVKMLQVKKNERSKHKNLMLGILQIHKFNSVSISMKQCRELKYL